MASFLQAHVSRSVPAVDYGGRNSPGRPISRPRRSVFDRIGIDANDNDNDNDNDKPRLLRNACRILILAYEIKN